MPRTAYLILCSCLIVFAGVVAGPADAGNRDDDYRDDGRYVDVAYPPQRPNRVWYSSSCCYMKIVRHVGHKREVRYVKVRSSRIKEAMLERQRERAGRRERVRERVRHSDRPRRVARYKVIVVRRDGEDDGERCRHRRVRVLKAGGGWTWALTARCE